MKSKSRRFKCSLLQGYRIFFVNFTHSSRRGLLECQMPRPCAAPLLYISHFGYESPRSRDPNEQHCMARKRGVRKRGSFSCRRRMRECRTLRRPPTHCRPPQGRPPMCRRHGRTPLVGRRLCKRDTHVCHRCGVCICRWHVLRTATRVLAMAKKAAE